MLERGVAACLEGSKGVPNLESMSFDACRDAEDTSALAAIIRREDLEPTAHVYQYFVGHCSQLASGSEGFESTGPDSPPRG